MAAPIEIFCCYARKDQSLLNELKAHLMPLQRQGLITLWADTDISAGTEWEQEISHHLNAAQIILLLISPNFMASEYCYSKEMSRAMERHEWGEARVIPIILRWALWRETPLGKLQALPTGGTPILDSTWDTADYAFCNVAEGIRKVVAKMMANNQDSTSSVLSYAPTGVKVRRLPAILVIESERLIAQLLKETLEIEGYQTATVLNGEDAIQFAQRETPHLIILDVMLPGIGGYEVIRRLREHPKSRHIPIIVVSAYARTSDKVHAFDVGADVYIPKPFSVEELLACIRRQLARIGILPTFSFPPS